MSLRLFLFIMPFRNDYILQRHSKFKLKKEETFIKKTKPSKKRMTVKTAVKQSRTIRKDSPASLM